MPVKKTLPNYKKQHNPQQHKYKRKQNSNSHNQIKPGKRYINDNITNNLILPGPSSTNPIVFNTAPITTEIHNLTKQQKTSDSAKKRKRKNEVPILPPGKKSRTACPKDPETLLSPLTCSDTVPSIVEPQDRLGIG